jgi:hypothetical protein
MFFVDHNKDPYLKKIDQIGPHEIWLVDGGWVRQHKEIEFTNYAQGRDPQFRGKIPMNEFWIEIGSDPSEFPFFLDRMLVESYYLSKLVPYQKAAREGIKIENQGRQRARKDRGDYKVPSINVHILEIVYPGFRNEKVKVWLVDGKAVRDNFDSDFTQGGHDLVYPDYIPSGEIWIDDTVPKHEHDFLVIHELNERNRMADGRSYEKAHPIASRIEYECRWSPQEKDKQMRELGLK